jgi:hypothetical protein
VASTSLILGAALVTGDGPIAKKKIPGLQIIFAPSSPAKRRVFSKKIWIYVALGCFIVSTLVFAILFFLK